MTIHFPTRPCTEQLGHIAIGLHTRETGLQALDDLRRLRIELTIIEGQVDFADQAITNLRVEVIGQHQLGRQGKKRQLDFRQIAGIQQLDPRIAEPLLLIEQLQHQRKHRAVEDVHVQPLKPGTLQQLHLQIAQPGAVDMHHRTVGRQAVGLKPGLAGAVMATGQLNAVDAQRRAQAFHQISLQQARCLQPASAQTAPASVAV